MAKSGMNPKTLQYLMGHSDIGVTLNVYSHVNFKDAEEEINRIYSSQSELKQLIKHCKVPIYKDLKGIETL